MERIDNGTEAMRVLARKLRAKSEWDYQSGWYTTHAESAANSAKREILGDIADLLDETFDFDSRITCQDREGRRGYKEFTP